ncbi:MAG: sulfurtransferase TusA family protein [Gammaproteobacteria bacterium]|jgi:tRNA 2-thiouridine synthesizing protein A
MNNGTVDARHLFCPLPVIRTQDAVAALHPGDSVRVLCTDPGAVHDIPAWCRVHGHEVCDISQQENEIVITLRIGTKG